MDMNYADLEHRSAHFITLYDFCRSERSMRLLVYLLLPATVLGFTVLPYIQIDYAHYFRLAQCKAKCAEKVRNEIDVKKKYF